MKFDEQINKVINEGISKGVKTFIESVLDWTIFDTNKGMVLAQDDGGIYVVLDTKIIEKIIKVHPEWLNTADDTYLEEIYDFINGNDNAILLSSG